MEHAKVLNNALRDELAHVLALALPVEKTRYFIQEQPLFSDVVAKQFPSLLHEIEECGKCYALGRSTASAFHAIRCLEAGIAAMSRCLGIPDPTRGSERSWGKLLGAIQKKLDARWPSSADRFSGDGRVFEEMLAVLSAIQNPYRNATMHLENKYTEEEALDIMSAVRRLMVTLASRMDENGDPKVV